MFKSLKASKFNNVAFIPDPALVDQTVESFFFDGSVVVGGSNISTEKVLSKIGSPLNVVSELLMQGKVDEATKLNNELLTKSVKGLIIAALSSAEAA
jgi:hypothetical protein